MSVWSLFAKPLSIPITHYEDLHTWTLAMLCLIIFFFPRKVVMAKNRTFFHSEEQAAFLRIKTNRVGQKISNRHQRSLRQPKSALISDAGKFSILLPQLCRIRSKATRHFLCLSPWENLATLQRDSVLFYYFFLIIFFFLKKLKESKLKCLYPNQNYRFWTVCKK